MTSPVQLVFFGEVISGFAPDEVKRTLGVLLKLDDAKLEGMFSGARVIINRSVDEAAASRHVARFAQLGARLHIEAVTAAAPLPSPEPVPVPVAVPSAAPPAVAARPRVRPLPGPMRPAPIKRRTLVWLAALAVFVVVGSSVLLKARSGRRVDAADPAALSRLSSPARSAFLTEYARAPEHKAFAASPGGAWGWRSGGFWQRDAVREALESCEAKRLPNSPKCVPIDVDGRAVAP